MKISVKQGNLEQADVDTIIVNLFEGVTEPGGATGAIDKALDGAITDLVAGGDFSGKAGDVAVVYTRGAIPARRVIIVGLGKQDGFDLEGARRAAGAAIKRAQSLKAERVATIAHGAGVAGLPVAAAAQATAEGSLLALYRYDAPKGRDEEPHELKSLAVVEYDQAKIEEIVAGVETAAALTEGVALARNLVNMPPNKATPKRMAKAAKKIAKAHDMELTVGGRKWAKKRDMGAFLAVAQGAGEKPKFIVLEHNGEREDLDTVVLVGKGITFDTGGISIKPTQGMGAMKGDMGGAAAVLGAMKVVGLLDLPLRVIGITPCTENMPDADAYRPADVITASNGKTIEIISTDAEGRMVLADGLVYAKRYEPKAVVDLATLTGSSQVALGKGVAGSLFSTDDTLRDKLVEAGKSVHERVWPMPLWDDYRKTIDSNVADVKNSGGRMGGVGTAAMFLKEFTDFPWAHIDMAGMELRDDDGPYTPRGGTGYGVRLLIEFLRNW